jgi:hypothetical protein
MNTRPTRLWLRFVRLRAATDRMRSRRHRELLLFCALLLGLPSFMRAATPITQLRGTIKDISSSGNKLTGETSFELNASDEKYGLRVIESVVRPARAGYHVSNLHDIFSSSVTASSADTSAHSMPPWASFRRGPLPDALAPRAQVLAYAHLALRLPKSGKDDGEFVDRVIPKFIVSAAEMEKSDLETHLVRNKEGGLERVNFWGHRPGTKLKALETTRDKNTKDTFLLASLVITAAANTMPVAGVFTVYGKRPGFTGTLVSFERKRYEFSGTVGATTDQEAFGSLTYYPAHAPKRITIFDYRFLEEDHGKTRSYGVNQGDELPFAKEKLPTPYYLMPKPNRGEEPQVIKPPTGESVDRGNP